MPEQFQQTVQTNALLQNDNVKLYEDNRALARVVAEQNDRLAFAAGQDKVKLKQFTEMRDKIDSLTKELTNLQRTNEVLRTPRGEPAYEKLVTEFQMLRARNDALQRDNTHLRQNHSALYQLAAARGILGPVPPGQAPVQHMRRTDGSGKDS